MEFLPSYPVFALFSAASFLLILTPGPDMTYFLGQTLAGECGVFAVRPLLARIN
jgi:threonine/homoserine/homoserine lactone efflux protein